MKICLNCGDKLVDAAKFCPTCKNKKNFEVVDRNDLERINEIIASVPNPKNGLRPKWEQKTNNIIGKSANSVQDRISENKKNGVACCPKCGSTSLSANKKGYSFVKGGIGATVGAATGVGAIIGLGLGNTGSGKVVVTCLNCGHRWKT